MKQSKQLSPAKKIAIVVDESKRTSLIEWSYFNREILSQHQIISNETTAGLLKGTLNKQIYTLAGTDGDGNRELAQMMMKGSVDILILLIDGGKSKIGFGMIDLLAIAREKNIIMACNQATADLVVTSLFSTGVNDSNQSPKPSNYTQEGPYSTKKQGLKQLRFPS